jgi:magnesium chelatase subunit D
VPNAPGHSSRRREQVRRSADDTRRGRYVRAVQTKTPGAKIALDATLRATLTAAGGLTPSSRAPALRYKRFNRKAGTLFIFALDASGSMAHNRIAQAKGALVELLRQSYVKRDRVAVVSFRGREASVMLRPSGSAARARGVLDGLGVGGATPLAAGLACALELARRERRRAGASQVVLLLFTDGRANVSIRQAAGADRIARRGAIEEELAGAGSALVGAGVTTVVVDTQSRFTSGGEARALAELIGGRYVYLPPMTDPCEKFASLVRA